MVKIHKLAFQILFPLPEFNNVINTQVPLSAVVDFSADRPVKAVYRIKNGAGEWVFKSPEFKKTHSQPLVGFATGERHEISVAIIDQKGQESVFQEPLIFNATVDGLPGIKGADSSVDAITLVSLFRYSEKEFPSGEIYIRPDSKYGLILAVNQRREVVWSYQADNLIDKIEPASPKTLTLVSAIGRETIDYMGSRVSLWRGDRQPQFPGKGLDSQELNASYLHSKSTILPNGNRLMVSAEARVVEGYPRSPENPEASEMEEMLSSGVQTAGKGRSDALIVEDSILEVSAEGEILKRWNLLDILDPKRQTYSSSLATYQHVFPAFGRLPKPRTWSQANSVGYIASTDTIVVSLKHQEAVVGFDREDGALKWILGDSVGWASPWSSKVLKPTVNSESYAGLYSPSSLIVTSEEELLLVDGGGYRAIPPNLPGALKDANPSAVVVQVDEKTMTFDIKHNIPVAGNETPLSKSQHWFRQQAVTVTESLDGNMVLADGLPGMLWQYHQDSKTRDLVFSLVEKKNMPRWGIADIVTIDKLVPPVSYQPVIPATEVQEVQPATFQPNESGKTTSIPNNDTEQRLKPNVSVPNRSIGGQWQITFGEGSDARGQKLVLQQKDQLVTGTLDGFPIVGWVKGNTLSITVRRPGENGSVRLRYRGVIDSFNESMEGTLTVDANRKLMGGSTWTANKLN